MRRQSASGVFDDRLRRGRLLARDHKGERSAGDGRDRHFLDLRHFVEDFLDVTRESGLFALIVRIPHVRLAGDDTEISIFVHLSHIPGHQPTVLGEDSARGFGVLPVPEHHLRTAHCQLADLSLLHFLAAACQIHDHGFGGRQRDADCTNFSLLPQRVGMGNRRGFGQTIPFHEAALRQFFKRFLHLHRQGRRAADARLDGFDAVTARAAEIIDRHIHVGDARENSRLVTLDGFQDIKHLELRFQDHRCADGNRDVHRRRQPIAVEDRHDAQ